MIQVPNSGSTSWFFILLFLGLSIRKVTVQSHFFLKSNWISTEFWREVELKGRKCIFFSLPSTRFPQTFKRKFEFSISGGSIFNSSTKLLKYFLWHIFYVFSRFPGGLNVKILNLSKYNFIPFIFWEKPRCVILVFCLRRN